MKQHNTNQPRQCGHPMTWTNCYNSGWQGMLMPEAFQHPAKVSRGLAKRIYQHALERGWLKESDIVLDPFGGIAGFAFHALQHGLHFVGVELEQKFVDLGQQNIALWNARYSRMPRWGSAVLLQGDSRRLSEVVHRSGLGPSARPQSRRLGRWPRDWRTLREAEICISSPPFLSNNVNIGAVGNTPAMRQQIHNSVKRDESYGSHAAQLGNMKEGDVDAVVDCAISSPPYAESLQAGKSGIDWSKRADFDQRSNPTGDGSVIRGESIAAGYGLSDGQLAAMPTGDIDAIVSSPPYVSSIAQSGAANDAAARTERKRQAGVDIDKSVNVGGPNSVLNRAQSYGRTNGQLAAMPMENVGLRTQPDYGDAAGDIGNATGDTFWQSAKTIVQQVHQVLRPGGMAIWVLKDFVRAKRIVRFCDQWQRMAESCGFETVEIIHAMLTEDRGAQYALDGELQTKTVERKSFFRRLHEFQASAKMYWKQHATDRDTRARYIRGAHRRLWEFYRAELAEGKKDPPARVTRTRILTEARTLAYKEAGEPWMDIDTRIDFEVVLCQRKPESEETE